MTIEREKPLWTCQLTAMFTGSPPFFCLLPEGTGNPLVYIWLSWIRESQNHPTRSSICKYLSGAALGSIWACNHFFVEKAAVLGFISQMDNRLCLSFLSQFKRFLSVLAKRALFSHSLLLLFEVLWHFSDFFIVKRKESCWMQAKKKKRRIAFLFNFDGQT